MSKVGFVGLGNMGKGMCKNIILKGNDVTVFDVNPIAMKQFEGKAKLADNVNDVLDGNDFIFLSLPNSNIVEKTIRGFIECGIEGKVIIDTSTSFPTSTRQLYEEIKLAGGALIDAPLIQGPTEVDAGVSISIVAGDKEVVEKADHLFRCYCKQFDYVGKIGTGHLIKLAQNFIAAAYAFVIAQGYALLERYGVEPQELYKHLNNEVFSTTVLQHWSEKYINRDYALDFSLELSMKDTAYVKRLYEEINCPAFIVDAMLDMCRVAIKEGKEQNGGKPVDFSYVSKMMNDYSGV